MGRGQYQISHLLGSLEGRGDRISRQESRKPQQAGVRPSAAQQASLTSAEPRERGQRNLSRQALALLPSARQAAAALALRRWSLASRAGARAAPRVLQPAAGSQAAGSSRQGSGPNLPQSRCLLVLLTSPASHLACWAVPPFICLEHDGLPL